MKLKELNKNPRNPRKITQEKLDAMRASIKKYGDLSGIVFNRRSKQIVSGHQRQATDLAEGEIEIIESYGAPNEQGTVAIGFVTLAGEKHKYREVDVDDIREKEMNLAANKHGGEWDYSILPEWLNELDHHNIDMSIVGWDDKELEKILAPTFENNSKEDLFDKQEHILIVTCKTESELVILYDEIDERGFECEIRSGK